jgi:hypothetical protein
MAEFIIGFFAFLIAVLLMGVGVLAGKRAIKGGCGHTSNIPGIEPACRGACQNPSRNKNCARNALPQG